MVKGGYVPGRTHPTDRARGQTTAMPTAVAAARQSYADHPMVRLETAPPGPCHAVSLQETLSGTFTACATVILSCENPKMSIPSVRLNRPTAAATTAFASASGLSPAPLPTGGDQSGDSIRERPDSYSKTCLSSLRGTALSGHLTGPLIQGVFMSHPARAAADPVPDANAYFPSIRRTSQQARVAPTRHRYHRHMTIPQGGQKTGHSGRRGAVSYSEIPLMTSRPETSPVRPSSTAATSTTKPSPTGSDTAKLIWKLVNRQPPMPDSPNGTKS